MKDQLECTRALERIKHINAEDTRTRLALAGFKSILGILVFVLLLLPGFSQVQPETVGQTVYSVSGYGFDIMGNMPNVSSITITSPGEAANWAQRTNQTISWDYTDNPGQTVKIELMQNGSAITTIPDSTANVSMGSNGSGSYTCQVPAVSVGNYKIRVTSVESSVYSATSPEFTITNPLAIIAPMASNAWCIGTTNNITWTYGDADIGSAVKLELLKNSSLVGDPIITSTQAGSNGTGSYAWTLPLTLEPGIDYQIRASSVDYPTIIATSANFTVTGNYTCSGNTLLGYNGPVSSLNSQGGNTGAVVVPIALGQTINGNIDKSDYFYPEAGGGIWQDEYQLVLHQDTEIALELHAPNGGYTRTLLYCDHASLPNGDKGTYSAFSGGDWVGNNTYRRPKAGFGDLSLGSNVYFPGLYRIVVFSDTPGPYTLKVLSPVAGTHINFTVENGNANAPQPVISDSNGHWTRDFDPASTYRITAEKTGYSVSPSSQVFDDPSDELDFELFSLASIPEIINLTLDKNMGVAGEIQTVNATIHATGAVDGTPVSICLLNTQGSNPLAPLFYPSPGDLDNKDLKKFWENLKEDPYQEITYKSIAANGTIINGQATVTMVIPDKLAPGYYQVRAQLAGSAGIMSTNYNISTATDVPSISSISLTPAQHNAGQSQYVDVSVETYNVTNGTSVTATLVNNDGSPLATPVGSVTGVISDNQVQLGLYLPSGVPAGHYSVKVTISLAEILTGFKPYHIVNYPDADAVDAAIEALIWEIIKGGNTTPDNITTNLKSPLPTTEPNGTSISWSADPVDWINTTTGAVTRPTTGQGHQTVVLTATISKGMFSGIKNFTLTIIDPAMVVTPSASLASGTYGGTQNITLSTATEGATIYYTTDNSKPTTASTPYTNMIEVASNMIIKAIAVKEGMENSPVSTFEYVIFAGGDGSIANPYQVATAEQLNNVRYHLDKHFQQTADIDLSSYYTGSGWEPIGSDGSPFTSIFNGNGKIISNLTINRSTENYTGLFGFNGTTAKIRNVKLENNAVTGQQHTGALVGYNQGTIANSYATGNVTSTDTYVGGLVGFNKSAISNSYTTSIVNGKQRTGGLVGDNQGTITNSYATGNVTSTDDFVGGLVGYNQQNSSITDSYAIGTVVGGQCSGGLVGYNQGTITRSYATGEISGKGKVAGLVGSNRSGTITNSYATGAVIGTENYVGGLVGWTYLGTITNAYSTGAVTGTGGVGGLVGGYDSEFSAPYVTNSYWDTNTSGVTSSAGGGGRTTTDMTGGTYGPGANMYVQWNFDSIWRYGGNNGYPSLRNNPPVGPDKTLISITAPSAITGITNGAAKEAAALGLPDRVTMITDRGNVKADVSWDVANCSYDPAVTTEQTFTVSGTVTLPTGVVNPNSVELTTSITVTVNAQAVEPNPTIASITAVNNVEVDYGTAEAAAIAALAATTTITGSNNDTHTVSLSWSIASYDGNTPGNYTATGTFALPAGVGQSDPETELKVTAAVTVNAAVSTDKTLVSITAPSAITGVANGTAKTSEALGLPAKVTLVTNDGNVKADVSWDVANCSYDPAVTTEQTFTVSGTVTLPTGVVNPNSVELTTSITVTVNAQAVEPNPTIASITAVNNVEVDYGTAEAAAIAALAATTTITGSNNDTHTVSLSWSIASYDGNTPGNYTATGTFALPAGVGQSDPETELKVTAAVTVNAAVSAVTYTLTITAATGGSITIGSSGNYAAGTVIDITATPASGYSFNKWISTGGGTFANANNASTTYTMPANPATITATFTYNSSSGGSPGGGGSSTTPSGTQVTSSGRTTSQNGVTLTFPAGAVESDIQVQVKETALSAGMTLPDNSQLLSRVMDIIKDKSGNFLKPVTITLSFDNSGLDPNEYDIAIYYYDEDTGKWIALNNIRLNFKSGTISGDTTHFTKFAVIANPKAINEEKPTKPVNPQPAVNIPSDISGHWAKDSIMKMINDGVISGYPDGTFKPDKTITRAEFTVMIVKALNLEAKAGKTFTDTASHWAKDSISTAAVHGIISGYDENIFGPDDLITREQAAVIISRTTQLEAANNELNFTDRKAISPWAKPGVTAAVKAGFITGYPDNSFRPQGNTTRAEAVSLILK